MNNYNFWFEEDAAELPASLVATINDIDSRQSQRYLDNLIYLGMYSGKKIQGLGVNNYSFYDGDESPIKLNVVQACTDTLVSKVGKNNPKISILTDKGNYAQQQKAKKLEKFVNGQFNRLGVYKITPKNLKHACIFGDGLIKIYQQKSKIYLEQALPNEIIVDAREAIDGKPQMLYQIKQISKYVLIKIYPEYEAEIEESCSKNFINSFSAYDAHYRNDMVPVIEAWRLCPQGATTGGRHVIAIPTKTILDEKWESDYFPFAKLSYSEKVMGYWSAGVSEILSEIQYEIDRMIKRISQSIWINSVPRVFYEFSSKIVKEQFSNEAGSLIGYRGTPPQIFTPTSVGSDTFNHFDRMWQKAFEIVGISQMSMGGRKPAELQSGKAIREAQDVESDRFAQLKSAYDDHHLEIARQIIDRAKDIYKYDKSYAVICEDQDGTVEIKWSEVDMKKDACVMQIYPTNLLSQTPAGRLADVIDMMNSSLLDKETAMSLLDFPDIKAVMGIENAQRDDILETINTMLETGKFLPPEIYQNLQLGIKYCQAFYLKYKNKKVPQATLDNLLKWITEANSLIQALTPAPETIPVEQSAPLPQATQPIV
jgi:hypothetical protein